MRSAARIAVFAILLASALVSAYRRRNPSSAKHRRDGMLNLYPFPRVGRAGPTTWQIPLDYDSEDYEWQMHAFPRVGRGDANLRELFGSDQFQPVPVKRGDSPGMWFGPRLGRSIKNDQDASSAKLRRDGMLNLYPFPRVGRTGRRPWQIPLDYDSEDYEWLMHAFPRVGRGDANLRELFGSDQFQPVPEKRGDSPGMWFGPRLGRSIKNDQDGGSMQDIASRANGIGMWFEHKVGGTAKSDENEMMQNEVFEQNEKVKMDLELIERKKRQAKPL